VYSLKLKFQTVAEKTAKNFRGLLYFAAPGIQSATYPTFAVFDAGYAKGVDEQ